MKRINSVIIALGLALTLTAAPAFAAPVESEPVDAALAAPEAQEIIVSVSGNTIRITGTAKQTLVVYYVTGTKAATYSIDTEDQTISTSLQKGIYLLKVGKFVRKVSIS